MTSSVRSTSIAASAESTVRVALVIVGPCSLLTLGLVLGTFAEVNRQERVIRYEVTVHTIGDSGARNGGRFAGSMPFVASVVCDWLWVLGDELATLSNSTQVVEQIARSARRARLLAGAHWGTWWMCRAGLFDGRNVSVNAEVYDDFVRAYPSVMANQRIFDIDGPCGSAAGGFAVVDLLLALITQQHGAALVQRVCSALNLPALRTRQVVQPSPELSLSARRDGRLMEALHLMETNLAEPISPTEIARLVGISARQLERLFREHLGDAPSTHYATLRLISAKLMLEQTNEPVFDIARKTGFRSAQYFSFAYRRKFGTRPVDQRRSRA